MDARITYRTLRITMVALAVMLGVSIGLLRWSGSRQVLGSISAYYFTPAHAVFVAAVCGLGICLVAYRGNTTPEEVLLDVAGILAFVVAFVPTSPGPPPYPAMPSAESPYVGTPNNIVAVLGGLAAGWVTYGLIIVLRNALQPPTESDRDSPLDRTVQTCATQLQRLGDAHPPTRWILPALSAIYLLIGGVLLLSWHRPYQDWVHLYAAVGMFGGIVLVALYYAVHAASNNDTMRARVGFAGAYTTIAVVMGALIVYIAARIFLTHEGVNVFWAEVAVIVLFTLFWFIQTLDLWDEEDKYRDAEAP